MPVAGKRQGLSERTRLPIITSFERILVSCSEPCSPQRPPFSVHGSPPGLYHGFKKIPPPPIEHWVAGKLGKFLLKTISLGAGVMARAFNPVNAQRCKFIKCVVVTPA